MANANHAILPPTVSTVAYPWTFGKKLRLADKLKNNENYPNHSSYQVQVGEYHGRETKASFWVVSGHGADTGWLGYEGVVRWGSHIFHAGGNHEPECSFGRFMVTCWLFHGLSLTVPRPVSPGACIAGGPDDHTPW